MAHLAAAAAILRSSRDDVPLTAWRDDAAGFDYLASVEQAARDVAASVTASGRATWMHPLSVALLLDYVAKCVAVSFTQPVPPSGPVDGGPK
jgi:hypothetical protein